MMQMKKYEGVPQDAPPIVRQPGISTANPETWMSIPVGMPNAVNCPFGLEYLTALDQLLVRQQVELLEALTGFEQENKYKIKNAVGQNVYYAVEDSSFCDRSCFGSLRPFNMKILDNFHNEVIHLYRPLKCNAVCFPNCMQSIEVYSPPGTLIGTVEQEFTFCRPVLGIKNVAGDTMLRIKGPKCQLNCCSDVDFHVFTMHSEKIGKISKQWSGLSRELFTDADNFGVTFPLDLDVRMKAILLAATFLIDINYFET